jgi:DNA-binding beta-propeller fold protein YncE
VKATRSDKQPRKQMPFGKSICAVIVCLAWIANVPAQEVAPLTLKKAISLDKVTGRIDHMAVDVAGERLFVAALGNDTVEVVALKAGKQIQSLSGFAEPQGIIYVPEYDRLFVANGSDGTCRILDGHSFKTIQTVEVGDDADNVRYDETAKKVYVGYGRGALGVLDAKTGAKLADIKLAGHPESFRLESAGTKIFVNVPNARHIAVVDREKASVIETWPLKEARSNFPMFLDETNHRLFVGCRSPAKVLVYDSNANRLITSIEIASDTDDLFYDPHSKILYVSCGGGSVEVIKQNDADHYQKLSAISTASGARTSLLIPELKLFCLAVPHRSGPQAEIRVYRTP